MFDHHYARYIVRKLTSEDRQDPNAGYLNPEPARWTKAHFEPDSYKSKRRRYFMEVKASPIESAPSKAARALARSSKPTAQGRKKRNAEGRAMVRDRQGRSNAINRHRIPRRRDAQNR